MIYFLMLCALFCVFVLAGSRYENNRFVVTKYKLHHAAIGKPIRLVYLSDLHENSYGDDNAELIGEICNAKPDIILLGGDLIIGKGKRVETEVAESFLSQLQNVAPIYYVYGNHETRVRGKSKFRQYENKVSKMPVHILNNEKAEVEMNGNHLSIYGLELESAIYENEEKFHAEGNVFEREENLKILLAHTPNYLKEYEKWKPDIVFSGHNHGGIVRLFGRGMVSTEYKIFPTYSYGMYTENRTKMILSSGAGSHTIKLRLFNPPEFVIVDLYGQDENEEG